MPVAIKHIRTSTLDVAYEESGAVDGVPVFLLHGWPYDPRCYDEVVPPLVAAGCRPDTAPRDAEWGERFFHVTDPDGHELSFAWPLRR